MLTFAQALNLSPGDVLYHSYNTNADGTPQEWKVNGKVKIWKRNPFRIRVPLKYGLFNCDSITEMDFNIEGICHFLRLSSE